MRAGTLNKRVTIQTRTETQGSTGEVTWTWADWQTVYAAVEPLTGTQYFAAQQVQSDVSTRIRIRHLDGITTKDRIKYTQHGTARYYSIEAVLPVKEGRQEIHLMCREREADGWRD